MITNALANSKTGYYVDLQSDIFITPNFGRPEKKSVDIREQYHKLEELYHGSRWSLEEDALAFLTDTGLVGRWGMDHEGRWPSDEREKLPAKIGECVWWLAEMSVRMGLDFNDCVTAFFKEKEDELAE